MPGLCSGGSCELIGLLRPTQGPEASQLVSWRESGLEPKPLVANLPYISLTSLLTPGRVGDKPLLYHKSLVGLLGANQTALGLLGEQCRCLAHFRHGAPLGEAERRER